ncbi:TRAP-type C4-dicarboxylate transport system, small permease component [Anaerovirgula multivorans]|uniref:TRAP-type C4-dicarboxylate transport system, small permease component n=1 Tax=Anaerovirgula multivorans TaxID=312168 RepID=A0A239C8X2_9FIRM|nr:TRAP transporter small permease subunit [Anaerovirgula multivorans]SNS15894.1 TRAP-type C4-dicarboxylate transport system, small permease component [Anaerovirgula multivorans]
MSDSKNLLINIVKKIHSIVDAFMKFLSVFTGYIIGIFMTILFVQVVLRFVFKSPIYGADELVTALMVWSMALGNSIVYWYNEHAVIEFCLKNAPPIAKRIMHHVTNIIVLTTSLVYIPGGIALFKMQQRLIPLGGLPFSKAYYFALPIIVMGILLVALSAVKTVEYIVLKDDNLMMPSFGGGGVKLD